MLIANFWLNQGEKKSRIHKDVVNYLEAFENFTSPFVVLFAQPEPPESVLLSPSSC